MQKLKSLTRLVVQTALDSAAITWVRARPTDTVLIVRLDAIGDFVVWQSFAKRLAEYYCPARVVLLANAITAELAGSTGYFDEVIGVNVNTLNYDWRARFSLLRRVRRLCAAVAVQPAYSRVFWTGDALIRASGAKKRIGSQGDCSNIRPWQKRVSDRWYTQLVPASPVQLHELLRNAEFLSGLTATEVPARISTFPPMTTLPDDLLPEGRFMVVVPGAGSERRIWPPERFAALARRVHQQTGLHLLVCGSSSEVSLAEVVARGSGVPSAQVLAGRTSVTQLVEIIRRAELVIANDSAAIHIAAATETPSLCLLGGGHFDRFVPYPDGSAKKAPEVVHAAMDCFGCNWQCTQPHAAQGPFPCIDAIGIDSALNAALSALEKKETS